jgi:plasmid replication initiation protein
MMTLQNSHPSDIVRELLIPAPANMTTDQKKAHSLANVSQSNELTAAKYDLSLQAKRVLWMCIMEAYKTGKDIKDISNVFTVNVSEYQHLFPMHSSNASKDVKRGIDDLTHNAVVFYLKTGEFEEVGMPWLSRYGVKRGRGAWEVVINSEIMPYIKGLTQEFTTFSLYDIQQLKTVRNIRLYENLCQYRSSGIWVTTPNWLAERFELPKSQRENTFEMRRTFLEPALKKINEHTPLEAAMTMGDDGKMIFTIVEKKPGA